MNAAAGALVAPLAAVCLPVSAPAVEPAPRSPSGPRPVGQIMAEVLARHGLAPRQALANEACSHIEAR